MHGKTVVLARGGPPLSIARDARSAEDATDMSHLFFRFPGAYGLDHFANRDFGVVRPKDTAIFVFVVVKSNSISVSCLQRRPFLQLCTPRYDGITQIDFVHKELLGR